MKSDSVTAVPEPSGPDPATFANVMGSWRTKSHVQDGCRRPSTSVPGPSFGGSVKPRRTSLSRRPSTAVSTVIMMVPYPAALARRSMSRTIARSRHTYTWNHFGPCVTAATSSMERVERVESV